MIPMVGQIVGDIVAQLLEHPPIINGSTTTPLRDAGKQIWLRNLMTFSSRLRYLLWRALPICCCLTMKLRAEQKLVLRRPPASDLGVAYEVFVA
jgi:hypothetical protein